MALPLLPAEDPLNSSDIEFEPVVSKRQYAVGQASIDKIVEEAQADRYTSKKVVKQLEFGYGSPSHRYAQDLWVRRFATFREHTLRQDLKTKFNGDDVVRCFDVIIPKLTPGIADKSVPGVEGLVRGLRVLIEYGRFQYDDWKLTPHEGARIKTFLSDAVHDGRLTKGIWQEKVWLSFMILARMSTTWLRHHLQNGSFLWDYTIARLMSVVLIAALGCRSGDITRASAYQGVEYIKWSDVSLTLNGPAVWENLRGHIVIRYGKGQKQLKNKNLNLFLQPLLDPQYRAACPVALMITHALRHGLVEGSTITDILTRASARPDRRVLWTHPDRPVCPSFQAGNSHDSAQCLLDKPAGSDQVLQSIKKMGLISNILSRVHTHATRAGHARDVAHLNPRHGKGFVSNVVRQSMNHTEKASRTGLTQNYVGDPTQEYYNDRAENQWVDPIGAKFSATSADAIVNAPVSIDEIEAWQALHDPTEADPTSKIAKSKARRSIRRDRFNAFLITEPESPSKGALHQRTAPQTNVMPEIEDLAFDIPIDPLLLDQDLDEGVNERDLDDLEGCLLLNDSAKATSQKPQMEAFATAATLKNLNATDDDHLSAVDFIRLYSTINVSTNINFARAWTQFEAKQMKYDGTKGPLMPTGNARDDPTPFLYKCKKSQGCTFETITSTTIVNHESYCTPEKVEIINLRASSEATFACKREDCQESFKTIGMLRGHEVKEHLTWEPRRCTIEGCNSSEIFLTSKRLSDHRRETHSGRFPTQCTVPKCTDTQQYKNIAAYSHHLVRKHGLNTKAAKKPYLPPEENKVVDVFTPCSCPVKDCTSKSIFQTWGKLKRHLTGVHDYTEDQAAEVRDDLHQSITTAERTTKRQAEMDAQANKSKKKRKIWVPSRCPVEHCTKPRIFTQFADLEQHVMHVHQFTNNQVCELSERLSQSMTSSARSEARQALADAKEQDSKVKKTGKGKSRP